MYKKIGTLFFAASLCVTAQAFASGAAHWGYTGHGGPENWGDLKPEFFMCKDGKNQSPIDLTPTVYAALEPLTLNYQAGGQEVVNNGHSIQVNYAPGSTLTLEGKTYELKQFHFHTPSENLIRGTSFPMEAHLVHADADGHLAVVALMFEEGPENKELAKAWAQMPQASGGQEKLVKVADANKLLPADLGYYRFNGSLTTPPCSEGVVWVVLKTAVTASAEQIAQFSKVMEHPNNRPVQPVNARIIAE